jgi:hypothetical protein
MQGHNASSSHVARRRAAQRAARRQRRARECTRAQPMQLPATSAAPRKGSRTDTRDGGRTLSMPHMGATNTTPSKANRPEAAAMNAMAPPMDSPARKKGRWSPEGGSAASSVVATCTARCASIAPGTPASPVRACRSARRGDTGTHARPPPTQRATRARVRAHRRHVPPLRRRGRRAATRAGAAAGTPAAGTACAGRRQGRDRTGLRTLHLLTHGGQGLLQSGAPGRQRVRVCGPQVGGKCHGVVHQVLVAGDKRQLAGGLAKADLVQACPPAHPPGAAQGPQAHQHTGTHRCTR